MNDSSTGGPLLPDPGTTPPLEGLALFQFLQSWVAGIIGIDIDLIRPRWTEDPVNIPEHGTAWVALGVQRGKLDTYPAVISHDPTADQNEGASTLIRHSTLIIRMSFYANTGIEGTADALAGLFADGLLIRQNFAPLFLAGFGLVEASDPQAVPSLFRERWQYRVDLQLTLRQATARQYPIRNVLSLDAGLVTSDRAAQGFPPIAITTQPSE